MLNDTITYDQPLNEIIRVCMRLEYLFTQIDHLIPDTSTLGTRNIINYLINILQILDRPDLKSKLAKELGQLHTNLLRYSKLPGVDPLKFATVASKLNDLSRSLIDSSGKIGHRLRDIEFLNSLRMHLASPGGACSFDLPLYHYWLEQPAVNRQQIIKDWLQEFSEVRMTTELVLDIVRNNGKTEEKSAVHGFYQELLDAQLNLRMIRIHVENSQLAFPEMSIGRHFMSVRWFYPDIMKKPAQFPDNLQFWISYCSF